MGLVYVVIENKPLVNRYKVINNSKYIALMILRIKMNIFKRLAKGTYFTVLFFLFVFTYSLEASGSYIQSEFYDVLNISYCLFFLYNTLIDWCECNVKFVIPRYVNYWLPRRTIPMLSPEYPYRTTQEIIIASMKPRVSPIYLICRSSGFKDNNNKLKVGTKTRKD
jgi:hypothetical protein